MLPGNSDLQPGLEMTSLKNYEFPLHKEIFESFKFHLENIFVYFFVRVFSCPK